MSELCSGPLFRPRQLSRLACVVAAPMILMGCSSVNSDSGTGDNAESALGYKPEMRAVEPAKDEVNGISSRLLEWMGVKGKVSEPGADFEPCESIDHDMKKYYKVHHPWSVYKLSKGTFEAAMQNLREQLPKHGWDIKKDGETKSQARNPEIVAVNRKSRHWVQIEWARERSGDLEQLITVDVDSRCYRAPEGTDL